ncbi:hypothetical protein Csa_005618 [Cucumis sativus]|uniref:Uncharacterized protein n=1 Tax=Cucumis sativus TaxID=3659 RepID=A0A0A0KDP0_CUCSA|nr:hypothetical protein Csa_005618 [Cucumis sativus]
MKRGRSGATLSSSSLAKAELHYRLPLEAAPLSSFWRGGVAALMKVFKLEYKGGVKLRLRA